MYSCREELTMDFATFIFGLVALLVVFKFNDAHAMAFKTVDLAGAEAY